MHVQRPQLQYVGWICEGLVVLGERAVASDQEMVRGFYVGR